MTDNSSKNKWTWNISDDHLDSCLRRFSSHEKLWLCPENWFIQSPYHVSMGRRTFLHSQLSSSCKAPKSASLHPNPWNKSLSSHCGVLIILISNTIALLNGLFPRNSIKGMSLTLEGFGFVLSHSSHSSSS